MTFSLKEKAYKGVLWSAVEHFSVQGVQLIIGLVIARLVMPGEYGLIAMLGIFLAVSNSFIDSGFGNALIQRKNRTTKDFSTVFYFNIAIAVVCYGLLYVAAPFIADFYHQPRLVGVTRIIGLTLIINALGAVQRAHFAIDINFKGTAKAALGAALLSGIVGIVLAYKGFGVWALVIQVVGAAAINTLLLWILSKWRPTLEYSWSSFRQMFSFGSKLLASGLLHTVYINLYTLVIGRFYNAADVGYYNRASTLSQYPSVNIMLLVSKALYPAQCQIQDDDERLANSFDQYLRMACFVIFPLSLLMAALSYPLVELVLTAKWLPAAPLLMILCIAYAWYPVMVVNNNILNVKGRSDYFLKAEIIKKVVALSILVVTLPFGIWWLCAGLLLYNILDMVIIIYYAKKVIRTGYRRQFRQIGPIVLISFLAAGAAWAMTQVFSSLWLQLFIGGLVGAAIFIMLTWVFKIKEFGILVEIVKKLWPKK